MKETSKAMTRRRRESFLEEVSPFFWDKVFHGYGLDVGSGDDPLSEVIREFLPSFDGSVRSFDAPDGAGDDIRYFIGHKQFDFVHGSQVLEHAIDPAVMLRSWLKVLKPGGYIVATVPDWELYEKRSWPSHWNQGHRSTWSMTVERPVHDTTFHHIERTAFDYHIKLPEWLQQFGAEVVLCRLVNTNYDYNAPADVDQTFEASKGVECFIEFVLRKAA